MGTAGSSGTARGHAHGSSHARPRRTSRQLWLLTGLLLAALIAALATLAPGAGALLTLDDLTVETGDTTLTSTSFTHSTSSGTNRLLLVSASWDDANDANISSATYGGNELTCLSPAKQNSKVASQMCYLVAPPTGSNTLDLTWVADVPEWAVVARSLTDVDQNQPIGATSLASGNGTSGVDTITTEEPDSVVFAHLGTENADISLNPAYDTVEDTETTAGVSSLGISAAAGRVNTTTAGTYDIGWNLSSGEAWAIDPAEVRRTPEQVYFNQSGSSSDESTSPATIGISMDRQSSGDVKVDYEVTGGNASSDDHNVTAGTATIKSGETWTTVELDITDDASDEPDETLELTLKNPRGGETSSPTTHTLTIADDDANQPPDPNAASYSTDEDTSLSDTLTATDPDQNDTIDSYAIDTQPSHGSVSLDTSTGDFSYSPDPDYNGGDSFTFTATDEHGATSTSATIDITVNAVNDAPSASDDSGSTDEDQAVWIDVLANDTDVDGDTLSVDATSTPNNGATSLPGNGTIEYAPDADWNGDDSFTYNVTDGSATVTATVNVTVNAVNDAPSASDDSGSTDEDQTVWIDVLANDSDVEGDSLSVASASLPSHGTTSLPGNGTVAYTPDADWNGDDSFTYDASDGSATVTATVTVTVNAVNDAPSASDDAASTGVDETVWIDVLANDTDVDDASLAVASAGTPANGQTSVPGNGTIAYTPDEGYQGPDSFTYDVSDGASLDTAIVNVTVEAARAEILSSNVRVLEGTVDAIPTLSTHASGSSVFLQLENATGGIGLGDLNATNETTFEINLTTSNFTTTMLMGRSQVVDWSNSTNDDGTENVSLQLQPISMAFIDDCETYDQFMGYCGPSTVDDWPNNTTEDQADVSFEAGLRVFLSDLSYLNATMQERMQGGYMTTDAQALGPVNVSGANSSGGPSLTIPVAGPHTLPDGSQNYGFFEARIPDGLLSWWGLEEPSRLTGEYEGENRSVEITDVDQGTKVRMDIHYSSGEVNITEDTTDPTADAGDDVTVDAGQTVTFDGSNSSDNQEVASYNWTFGDGENATGVQPSHSFDETGTYVVTLNVSDRAGNTDEDNLTVTVESDSSGGGGGGGGGGGVASVDDSDDEDEESTVNETSTATNETSTDTDEAEDSPTAGDGGGGLETQTATETEGADREDRASPSDDEPKATSASDDEEGSSSSRASPAYETADEGMKIGAWIIWLVVVPLSVLGIRRWA